jgi:hypothetical protein
MTSYMGIEVNVLKNADELPLATAFIFSHMAKR